MENQYGVVKSKQPEFPVRELLVVPNKDGDLTLSHPAFGPNTYKGNIGNMGKSYSHPLTGETITFRPATTSESISAASYDFEKMAKPEIFDPRWLQIGYIVRTQEGVFTNTTETDESKLKQLLDKAEKVNGIYLINDNMAFAPYESFSRGTQDCDTFAHGGLARALEHTPEKVAKNLREMASPRIYKKGVNVDYFDKSKEPALRVACLSSSGGVDGSGLHVGGDYWDDCSLGYAFGVLNKSRSDAQKN
jgi:hypothetical protein